MANFLKTLFSLALLIALVNPVRSQTVSTFFDYNFNGERPTTLTYQGAAHFPTDSTYLRLTSTNATGYPDINNVGRAVHSRPILFRSGEWQADFETTIKFIITSVDSHPADGLAFFIAPVGTLIPPGSLGGNLGVFFDSDTTSFHFAVEFDINGNEWDPSYRHVGIDIASRVSPNTTRVEFGLIDQVVTARINYVAATKLISVHVNTGSQNYEVSYMHDLSTLLPEQVQVGISAATGYTIAVHDVISWYFISTLPSGANEEAHIRQIV